MCLVIKYPQGEVEYSGLVKVEGFESILEGSLIASGEVKQGSRVSVTLKDGNKALVSWKYCVPAQKQFFGFITPLS